MKTLSPVDVVIIGSGFTGLLMAKELGARTALSVVVLERGGPQTTTDYARDMDELDYFIRYRMMQDLSQETVTLRHNLGERALPIRQYGSFLPGTGVGGTGEHWGAAFPRYLPDCFELLSKTVEKYGMKKLPEDHSVQDWGISYDEIEPYYARAEKMIGVSGKAGNLRGKKIDGGNIFEGWRSTEYPMPPVKIPYFSALCSNAANKLGYHPYPNPSAVNTQAYTIPDGVIRSACQYCGYCERMGCMVAAKAQPTNTFLPIVEKQKHVSIRTRAYARRIVPDKSTGKVRGVNYIDASGEEIFQPAELVFLASWTINNTRLLLLSELGDPYDPVTGKGTLGRNLTHQVNFGAAQAFFDKPLNRFMGAGPSGIRMSDFDGDVFDHANLPFLRGGTLGAVVSGIQPIGAFGAIPKSIPLKWGAEWKRHSIAHYDHNASVAFAGEHLAYKGNYMDLDPTYRDHFGDPLIRLTLDWRDNERKMAEFVVPKAVELARAMGAKDVEPFVGYGRYDTRRYQSTHVQGGTIMGATPAHGVLNPYLQHWQFPNLFVLGASSFPQQGSANPTPTILALAHRTADAIVDRYLKRPGPLV